MSDQSYKTKSSFNSTGYTENSVTYCRWSSQIRTYWFAFCEYTCIYIQVELAVVQRIQRGCFRRQGATLTRVLVRPWYVTCFILILRHSFLICQMHQDLHKTSIYKYIKRKYIKDKIEGGVEGRNPGLLVPLRICWSE